METPHYHERCPWCHEEAIRERCPAFRPEWAITPEPMSETVIMVRIWYLDHTYMDVSRDESDSYECDPAYSHSEELVENDYDVTYR